MYIDRLTAASVIDCCLYRHVATIEHAVVTPPAGCVDADVATGAGEHFLRLYLIADTARGKRASAGGVVGVDRDVRPATRTYGHIHVCKGRVISPCVVHADIKRIGDVIAPGAPYVIDPKVACRIRKICGIRRNVSG